MRITRRQLSVLLAGAPLQPYRFRWAICNETFSRAPFVEGCRIARRTGYTGLEVAPFTLSGDPASLTRSRRAELRRMMESENLSFVGLHAFLNVPKGLHLTCGSAQLRERSWDYFRRMVNLSAELGRGSVMVLGSAKQRSAVDGVSVEEAVARLRDGLAGLSSHAMAQRVTFSSSR